MHGFAECSMIYETDERDLSFVSLREKFYDALIKHVSGKVFQETVMRSRKLSADETSCK